MLQFKHINKLYIVNYGFISESAMFMSFTFFVLSNIVVSINFVKVFFELGSFLIYVPPEEDSRSTGEKQIDDLHFSICISKSSICFYPVTPESSSGVTKINNCGKKVPTRKLRNDLLQDNMN